MEEKNLIVKSNVVVEASYRLTLNEQRIILSAIAKIPKGKPVSDKCQYHVLTSDFIELGANKDNAARDIRAAAERLYRREISIKHENKILKTRWLQSIKYSDISNYREWSNDVMDCFIDGMLERSVEEEDEFMESYAAASVQFSAFILPFLSNLSENFTKYLKSDIAEMRGTYSIRFYELIKQYDSIGGRTISLKDFREMLDLEDKYPLTADLKRWVIEPAVEEINEKSPMLLGYKLIKTGRKYTHITLNFKKKVNKTVVEKVYRDKNTMDIFTGLSDAQVSMFANKIAYLPSASDLALPGEDHKTFANRLERMLEEPEKAQQLMPYLKEVGYKPPKAIKS